MGGMIGTDIKKSATETVSFRDRKNVNGSAMITVRAAGQLTELSYNND